MNAFHFTFTTPKNRTIVSELVHAVNDNYFLNAEQLLLDYIQDILVCEYNTDYDLTIIRETLQTIYFRFNHVYKQVTGKEASQSDEHDNYLLSICSDPASMDDLIYETLGFLKNDENEEQKKLVEHHLQHYLVGLRQQISA